MAEPCGLRLGECDDAILIAEIVLKHTNQTVCDRPAVPLRV